MQDKKENKQTAPTGDIAFELGFKEKTRFDLRFISVAEEEAIQEKFNNFADLTDEDDKAEKEYQVCLSALVEASEDAAAGEALRVKFLDRKSNKYNEREIRAAYWTFKKRLQPDVVFL